jgi:hypothetical protein
MVGFIQDDTLYKGVDEIAIEFDMNIFQFKYPHFSLNMIVDDELFVCLAKVRIPKEEELGKDFKFDIIWENPKYGGMTKKARTKLSNWLSDGVWNSFDGDRDGTYPTIRVLWDKWLSTIVSYVDKKAIRRLIKELFPEGVPKWLNDPASL